MSEQQIPLPRNRTGVTDVLRDMEPGGEPVLFLDTKVFNISALCSYVEKGGFRCRTEGNNVRCWRLKRED